MRTVKPVLIGAIASWVFITLIYGFSAGLTLFYIAAALCYLLLARFWPLLVRQRSAPAPKPNIWQSHAAKNRVLSAEEAEQFELASEYGVGLAICIALSITFRFDLPLLATAFLFSVTYVTILKYIRHELNIPT